MSTQDFAPKEQTPRKIEVYATSGTCQAEFTSSAGNVSQLKKELAAKGIPFNGMKMVVGETQEELTEDEQLLYEQDMTLFLTPIKVRSGWFFGLLRYLGLSI